MNVLFVGLGSIGTRHLKNLTALAQRRGLPLRADAWRHDDRPLPPDTAALLHRQYVGDAPQQRYDAVFITNPTTLHYSAIRALSGRTDCFFIEKPVFESPEHTLEACGLAGKKAYVAAPMRWCGVFHELRRQLAARTVYSARILCSSYLPDWRPGVDYRTVYSARRALGGGVSIDLIHEWDYLVELFGFPQQCCTLRGKVSDLEIDSDDLSVAVARYPGMMAELHLDYFGRTYRRSIELLCADGQLTADFGAGTLTLENGEVISCAEPVNRRFEREMDYFLDYCAGPQTESLNSPQRALQVLRLALGEPMAGPDGLQKGEDRQ